MILNPANAKDIENKFRAIYDLKQQNKDNNSSINDLIKSVADSLQIDKKIVKAAFTSWSSDETKKVQEDGNELLEAIKAVKEPQQN